MGKTVALLAVLLALALGALAPGLARADHDVGPTEVYFSPTGHTLRGDFLDYWRHHGGLPIFGYPLTEEITAKDGVTRQYFERAVFERNPDGEGEWAVLLQRLGAELTKQRSHTQPFRPLPETDAPNCDYFAETGHRVCNGFREYWEEYGGLPVFGFPLSEEFTENGRTVQYFERARFEFHPELGEGGAVQLGLLGSFLVQDRGLPTDPANLGANPNALWFEQTNQAIHGAFRLFWEQHGGLEKFGLPLTAEIVENGVLVQYFERARFEYAMTPDGSGFEVRLGDIGSEALEVPGWYR